MFRTLYAKLSAGLFLLLLAVGLVYALVSSTALKHYQETVNQEVNRNLARNLIFDRDLVDRGRIDQDALKATFALYMTINPGIEIYLLDSTGRILSYSADPQKIKRNSVSLEPIRRFLEDDSVYPLLGDDPRSHDRRKIFSVAPLPSAENVEGYLYVVLRGQEYDSAERMVREIRFLELSAWSVALALAFGLVAGLFVFRLLTRRLEFLSRRVEAFEAGTPGAYPADGDGASGGGDEIDRLNLTFGRMAVRIENQIDQLRRQDTMRRELVAHASHDLRTPLASLRGYLESLRLKEATLDPEERRRFLDIALGEARRLSRLIDELFELAALEAREREPAPEAFSPAELAHDVASKHQATAQASGVRFEVQGGAGTPQAWGDVAMTERVLDNLIDNAVGHVPPNGHIRIKVVAGPDGAPRIIVTDDGPGIAAGDLPHLFEPFYRTGGRQAGKWRKKGHAGLGLAIAKRMMTLQGGDIVAENAPEGGARFTLCLPAFPPKGRNDVTEL